MQIGSIGDQVKIGYKVSTFEGKNVLVEERTILRIPKKATSTSSPEENKGDASELLGSIMGERHHAIGENECDRG